MENFIKKPVVVLKGPFLTSSGYGVHSRQIAKYFIEKSVNGEIELHIRPLPWGICPWILNKDEYNGLINQIMICSTYFDGQFDLSVQVQLPNEWEPNLAKYNVGITAACETDKCNPEWITCCNKMNSVIVPSKHSKNNLEFYKENLTTKISIIPESFPDIFNSDNLNKNDLINLDTNFNFLVVGQLTGQNVANDRKNIFNTLKWLCEIFKDNKDIGIVIKTNSGTNSKIDRQNVTNLLHALIKEIRPNISYPKIYLLHGLLKDEEMLKIYKHSKIKSLICASRGEGFGLPLLEAAACGLPVIATNWSGYLDFMNLGKFIKLNYSLETIHSSRVDQNIFMKDSKWAEVSSEDFKTKIKKFYESSLIPKEWAIELSRIIKEKYSFKAISNIYDTFFNPLIENLINRDST